MPAAPTTTPADVAALAPEVRSSTALRVGVGLLVVWLAGWSWCGRYHMLDDALIHLRYAEQLAATGRLTYNGDSANFGSSSLLYVMLLALCRGLWAASAPAALLPKAVSCAAYLALSLAIGVRCLRAADPCARGVWLWLWLAVSGPLGLRWLTDGMETSLTLMAALAVTASSQRLARESRLRAHHVAVASTWAGLAVALRIELAGLVAVIGCAAVLLAWRLCPSRVSRLAPVFAAALGVLACVRLWTGHVLPDTALAKAHGAVSGRAVLAVIAASGSLGIGSCAAWLASCWLAGTRLRAESRASWLWPTLLANALFPVLVALIVARGQALQGVRYLAWAWVASITWNASLLEVARGRVPHVAAVNTVLRVGAALLGLLWAAEAPATWRILDGRSDAYLRMSGSDWSGFRGVRAVAGDIGFFGYFSRAELCDLSGLVNGRAFARVSSEERARRCAAFDPAVAFLTESQRRLLAPSLELRGWTRCGRIHFTNVASLDEHELLLRPEGGLRCPRGFAAARDP